MLYVGLNGSLRLENNLDNRASTWQLPLMSNFHHVHMVGVGGAGMGGIAEILLDLGYEVSGSDLNDNKMSQRLHVMMTAQKEIVEIGG